MKDSVKLAYWKQRINNRIVGLIGEVGHRLLKIKDDFEYIGADKDEVKEVIKFIADSFDSLSVLINKIEPEKEEKKKE